VRDLKVLFVYKFLTLGGVEAVLRTRLAGLPDLGIDARAWFFHDLGGRPLFRDLEDRLLVGPPGAAVDWARSNGVDLVCTIDSEEVLPALAAAGGPRWILECHSGYVENLGYLESLGDAPPALVLVPSREQARLVRDRMGGAAVELRVVPNPVAAELLAPLVPFPAPPPSPVVAWVGRLDELKNWRGLLEIGAHLDAAGVRCELWIAGRARDAEGSGALLATARERGVLPRLRWLAGLPHARMGPFFDAVRDSGGVLVSTSRRESFGLTVAEAMARGCAVVVPHQPPFTELVSWPDGLYPPGHWRAAADRVRHLLADPALRTEAAERGRAIVGEQLSPSRALAALAAALREAAAPPPSA
jgi:glycosyltransferase involved in cell wall biosynthesis